MSLSLFGRKKKVDIYSFDMITDITVGPLQFSSNFQILSIHTGIVLAAESSVKLWGIWEVFRWFILRGGLQNSKIKKLCILCTNGQGIDSVFLIVLDHMMTYTERRYKCLIRLCLNITALPLYISVVKQTHCQQCCKSIRTVYDSILFLLYGFVLMYWSMFTCHLTKNWHFWHFVYFLWDEQCASQIVV